MLKLTARRCRSRQGTALRPSCRREPRSHVVRSTGNDLPSHFNVCGTVTAKASAVTAAEDTEAATATLTTISPSENNVPKNGNPVVVSVVPPKPRTIRQLKPQTIQPGGDAKTLENHTFQTFGRGRQGNKSICQRTPPSRCITVPVTKHPVRGGGVVPVDHSTLLSPSVVERAAVRLTDRSAGGGKRCQLASSGKSSPNTKAVRLYRPPKG